MNSAALLNCKYDYPDVSDFFGLPHPILNKSHIVASKGSYFSSFLWNDIQFWFREIKKHFICIKTLALNKINLIHGQDPFTYMQNFRIDVSKVFQGILNNLQSISSSFSSDIHTNSKIIISLIKEIKSLLLFVGRINDIPNIINIVDSAYSSDYNYYYVHICLEVWYNSITVLATVNNIPLSEESLVSFCDELDQLDPYLQAITLFVIDFVCITIRSYRNSNSLSSSPFMCKCFADFWEMLIKILSPKLDDGNYSFWTVYHNAIQNVQKHIKSDKSGIDIPTIDLFSLLNDSIECSQISESCLWLTSHIAPLYISNGKHTVSGYPIVKFLIHSLLNSSERTEKSLRHALFFTWNIVCLWEPSSEVLLTLTDFYIKKIDETFSFNEKGLQDLTYLFSDSISWFKYIDSLSNPCITVRNETSFYVYLRILYKQLTMDSSEENLWRSLKGRIYSKFMPKKFIELSEVGLQNSFSLILTVAASGQVEAVDKISSLVSIFKSCSTKKQLISWKALFVLMLIYQKKGLNINKIAAKAIDFFNSKCSEYSATKDNLNKINIVTLLLVYINGMKEIFKQCDCLKLSECDLVASGFSSFLPSCSVFEQNNILHSLLEIFQKVKDTACNVKSTHNSIMLPEYLTFLEHSFKYIFPFLQDISCRDTPPTVVADIAAVLTVLSYKFSSRPTKQVVHSFSSIFLFFGCKESVNSSVMCHYLYLILKNQSLQTMLERALPNFTSSIFQSWLKLVIDPPTLPPSCEEIHDLSFKILLLKDFVETFPKVQDLDYRSNTIDIAIKVFEVMGQTLQEISVLELKHQLKKKTVNYFHTFASHVWNIVQKHLSSSLKLVYKVTSHLVYHCSLLLHNRYKSNSYLPILFDKVFPSPSTFASDPKILSVLSLAVNEFLPLFLKGIFKLDYRNDHFPKRAVKHMINNHIFVCPSANSSVKKLLIATVCNKDGCLKWDEYVFILDNILDCITGSDENPVNAFEIMFQVFNAAPLDKNKHITVNLLKSALEVYMRQTGTVSEYLLNLMRKIFTFFKKFMNLKCSEDILFPVLQWFIKEKIQWAVVRGFNVLDTVSDYLPQVVSDLIPFLIKTVEELESSRGSGEDLVIRNHLKSTINKLQRILSVQDAAFKSA